MCRHTGEAGQQLYHPCLCTGSIKYVHQECLLQWLKYSKKDVCELCNHKFSFRPVYREDMPDRLPLYEIVKGLITGDHLHIGFPNFSLFQILTLHFRRNGNGCR